MTDAEILEAARQILLRHGNGATATLSIDGDGRPIFEIQYGVEVEAA